MIVNPTGSHSPLAVLHMNSPDGPASHMDGMSSVPLELKTVKLEEAQKAPNCAYRSGAGRQGETRKGRGKRGRSQRPENEGPRNDSSPFGLRGGAPESQELAEDAEALVSVQIPEECMPAQSPEHTRASDPVRGNRLRFHASRSCPMQCIFEKIERFTGADLIEY